MRKKRERTKFHSGLSGITVYGVNASTDKQLYELDLIAHRYKEESEGIFSKGRRKYKLEFIEGKGNEANCFKMRVIRK